MNYKLEKFWNQAKLKASKSLPSMNYKLEKFWNFHIHPLNRLPSFMNYKLEKFWNACSLTEFLHLSLWTINLKSFEIIPLLVWYLDTYDEL